MLVNVFYRHFIVSKGLGPHLKTSGTVHRRTYRAADGLHLRPDGQLQVGPAEIDLELPDPRTCPVEAAARDRDGDAVHPAGDAVEQYDPLLARQQAVGGRQPTEGDGILAVRPPNVQRVIPERRQQHRRVHRSR